MNKMTIVIIVLVLALVSFGGLVYAANKPDSTKIEKTEKITTDSMVKVQAQAIDSLRAEITKIKSSNDSDRSSLRIYLVVGLVCVVIFFLFFVLAFLMLAEKAKKKKVEIVLNQLNTKIESIKEDLRNTGSRNTTSNSGQGTQQYPPYRKGGNDKKHPGHNRQAGGTVSIPTPPPPPPHDPKQPPKTIEKVVYLTNNEGDVFIKISDQRQDNSTFMVRFDPEDKSNFGELSAIGNINALKVMNRESRDCSIKLVKSQCDWTEASDYTQDHVGKVRWDNEEKVWKIINPVEIILKKQ